MKAAVVIKGKLVFLEGTPQEICEAVEGLGINEFRINFIQPETDPASWEALRDYIKGVTETNV